MEENIRSISHDQNPSTSRRASSKKTYVIPVMTTGDILEAIQDWMEKHQERVQCSRGFNQMMPVERDTEAKGGDDQW